VKITPEIRVTYRPIASLISNPRNARTHSARQVRQIADSIRAFGFLNPILIDDAGIVVAGHGRLAAAKLLGMERVPTVAASGLSEAERRAYALADNRLAEKSGWDRERLAAELGELAILLPPLELDLTATGFEPADIDVVLADRGTPRPDPIDAVPAVPRVATARRGDLWQLGDHRLLCGDARSETDFDRLMGGARARLTFTDPPYNVPIAGHVKGRQGRVRHQEFAFASGEMDQPAFAAFLQAALTNIARASLDGAIAFVCMDWRHLVEISAAGAAAFAELKNVVVWNKTAAGQGSLYRSQHELIFVFKVGRAEHRNSFGLGASGRTRSNVWTYPAPAAATSQAGLTQHPTVKPVALVADALRDCSLKGDAVLDPFLGSGTTLMAAERLGRRGFAMEYEPSYVDTAILRWQAYTKADAVLEGDGRSWAEVAAARKAGAEPLPPDSGGARRTRPVRASSPDLGASR